MAIFQHRDDKSPGANPLLETCLESLLEGDPGQLAAAATSWFSDTQDTVFYDSKNYIVRHQFEKPSAL